MNIKEQVEFVNLKLKKGDSIAKIEKELKLGKDTLIRWMNKGGYIYTEELKSFELNPYFKLTKEQANKSTNQQSNKQTNNKATNKQNNKPTNKQNNRATNKQNNSEKLSLEEIKILKAWIKTKESLDSDIEKIMGNGSFKATTLEIEINLYKKLNEYCYKNNETKKSIVNKALLKYFKAIT